MILDGAAYRFTFFWNKRGGKSRFVKRDEK